MIRTLFFILCVIFNVNLYCQQDKSGSEESTYNNYRLSQHKGLYAVVGSPDTKISVSLKYQITSYLNLYFAYTQMMFWEIGKASAPFRDINFNPELFYRINLPKVKFIKAIDFGIFEHKSNGKDGLNSRSWNSSYFKVYTRTDFSSWSFNWDTKFYWFYRFQMDNTNADIRNYSGFWDTRLSLINYYDEDKKVDRISLYFDIFPGGRYSQQWNKGGQELGLKFRVGAGTFYPSLFFQFYHGYNESLLDYNVEHSSYRVGISF